MKNIISRFLFGKDKISKVHIHHFADNAFPTSRDNIRGVFDKIYRDGMWGNGSGGGSLPDAVKLYTNYLEGFIGEHDVKSVVDLGCGDWQFSRFIDWGGIKYTGIDVVEDLIMENKRQFEKDNISFCCINVLREGFDILPSADLLISKDVLQHLSNENVALVLKGALSGKYKYLMITNDYYRGDAIDIPNGDTRPLDITRAPFNIWNATPVLSFFGKTTFLIQHKTDGEAHMFPS